MSSMTDIELEIEIRILRRELAELETKERDQTKIFLDKVRKDEDELLKKFRENVTEVESCNNQTKIFLDKVRKDEDELQKKIRENVTEVESCKKSLELKKQFSELLSRYDTNKDKILCLLEDIKNFKELISKAVSEQNKEQLTGKRINLAGSMFGLISVVGVLTPGVIPLTFALASSTTSVCGMVNQLIGKDFDKIISDKTDKCKCNYEAILKLFEITESIIGEMETIVEHYADIRRHISTISKSVSSRACIGKGVLAVKIGLGVHNVYKDALALKEHIVKNGAKKCRRAKLPSVTGPEPFFKRCTHSRKAVSKSARRATGISKLSLGLNAACFCYDAYTLRNHKEQIHQAEIDIGNVITDIEGRLDDMNRFVSEAKHTFHLI